MFVTDRSAQLSSQMLAILFWTAARCWRSCDLQLFSVLLPSDRNCGFPLYGRPLVARHWGLWLREHARRDPASSSIGTN